MSGVRGLTLRAGGVSCLVVGAVAAWGSPATSRAQVPAEGSYRGTGTEIVTSPDGSAVTINRVPVRVTCKGSRPSNLGEDLGPFPIKRDGSFTNGVKKTKSGSGKVVLSGKFSSDGTKVSGRIAQADFVDKAKGFDCPSYKGTFSAKLVKGTGLRPGQVLARDDFSDSTSGFDTFNSQNSFGGYLTDGRYRLGLRGPGAAFALRAEPAAALVDVKATVRWYGNDEQDGAGLICQATGQGSFSLALIRGNGQVELKRYLNGASFESAPPTSAPVGLLKSGQGEGNRLELACVPDASEQATHITLSVNGKVVRRAKTSAVESGKTGFFVEDQAGGTDFNFEDYVASVPKP